MDVPITCHSEKDLTGVVCDLLQVHRLRGPSCRDYKLKFRFHVVTLTNEGKDFPKVVFFRITVFVQMGGPEMLSGRLLPILQKIGSFLFVTSCAKKWSLSCDVQLHCSRNLRGRLV